MPMNLSNSPEILDIPPTPMTHIEPLSHIEVIWFCWTSLNLSVSVLVSKGKSFLCDGVLKRRRLNVPHSDLPQI